MSPEIAPPRESKFTRGEKCIFVHLVITFAIILVLIIAYFVHLCLVHHTQNEVFQISRRVLEEESPVLSNQSIGVVYLNVKPAKIICNTLLLRQQWSLTPAQCAAMRSDPDMSPFLLLWKIKYKNGDHKYFETDVRRALTHSHFNRDDYSNNIGLFEHQDLITLKEYAIPNLKYEINDAVLVKHASDMNIFGWEITSTNKGNGLAAAVMNVRALTMERCTIYVTPVINTMRKYEFCVTPVRIGPSLDHGALFIMDSRVIGFFSWGDISGRGVPFIILNILHFREWFENIMSL